MGGQILKFFEKMSKFWVRPLLWQLGDFFGPKQQTAEKIDLFRGFLGNDEFSQFRVGGAMGSFLGINLVPNVRDKKLFF